MLSLLVTFYGAFLTLIVMRPMPIKLAWLISQIIVNVTKVRFRSLAVFLFLWETFAII